MRGSFLAEGPLVDAKKFEAACLAALIVVFESCVLKSCRVQGVSSLLWSCSSPPPAGVWDLVIATAPAMNGNSRSPFAVRCENAHVEQACREPTASTLKAVSAQPGPLRPKPVHDEAMCWYALVGVRVAFSSDATGFRFRRKCKKNCECHGNLNCSRLRGTGIT